MRRVPPPLPPDDPLTVMLDECITWGDAAEWLPALTASSVDLFFMSPPYADARAYSRIHPDRYVEWFLDFARPMLSATKDSGWFVLNIKNRVVRGQRHPYVYELVLAIQRMGWRWVETYIWSKPNAIPGRFGPRTKDAFEYVYAFARGERPHFDLNAVRVPYRTTREEIVRRNLDANGRRNTDAGFGRDRRKTYRKGGADPGNVISVPQTYNQHYGPAGDHTAVMPEGLAAFFIKACCPPRGVVIDPFAGSATTSVVARRLGRLAGGLDIHREHVERGRRRLADDVAEAEPGVLRVAV
jgi:DNA modification methylase